MHQYGESLYSSTKAKIYVTALENIISETEILLFPNPASDFIYLKNLPQLDKTEYRIFNSQGIMVEESGKENFTGTESAIDISGLTPGVYTMQILLEEQTKILRFVKQ